MPLFRNKMKADKFEGYLNQLDLCPADGMYRINESDYREMSGEQAREFMAKSRERNLSVRVTDGHSEVRETKEGKIL